MKGLRRIVCFILAFMMVFYVAPSVAVSAEEMDAASETQITLWTYPIGGWGDSYTVDRLIADFESDNPGIEVKVEYLTYVDGDHKVNTALEAGAAPDLILEGPERLVANWGQKGRMVDLSDILTAEDAAEINPAVLAACCGADGAIYQYPLAMTTHCMAINKTVFEAAGAMQYINAETHTWNSVDDFLAAVDAVYAYTGKQVGAVYCAGQGGDQGTRALVTNLKGGSFTNTEHTAYTWDSAENIDALQTLIDCEGIAFDAGIAGGDEIALFYDGILNMAFCWNIAQQMNPYSANTGAEKTLNGDDIMFLAFPADGEAKLQGGIWGFGIFDNGDAAKIEAAKTFIKYFCDSEATADAVKAANYFAVRDTAESADLSTIWADNAIMAEYNVLMPLLGDYYQVTSGWAEARTAWWNMLQEVGNGGDIREIVSQYNTMVNHGIFEDDEQETSFEDVPADAFYANAVQWAVDENVTTGLSTTSFGPNEPCTRSQIVTFLWRAAGEPEPGSSANPFLDVNPADFYYKAVLWAVEQGITTGLSATSFGPNAPCTRGQVATFLWRYAGEPAPTSGNPFSDVAAKDFCYQAVLWAVENDVTTGVGGGRFAPNDTCTRGQIVTFLYRAVA